MALPTPPPPLNQQQPSTLLLLLLLTSPLYSGGETTDFLPVLCVCFSKRQYVSLYHFNMFHITKPLRVMLSNQCFSLEKKVLSSPVSLIYTKTSLLSVSPSSSLTDSLGFAAGSQSAVVRHPLLEQPEPRCSAQPRPAAGPQLPLPGKRHVKV